MTVILATKTDAPRLGPAILIMVRVPDAPLTVITPEVLSRDVHLPETEIPIKNAKVLADSLHRPHTHGIDLRPHQGRSKVLCLL